MLRILAVALGGALGALMRYGFTGAAHRFLGGSFPWGTLGVNLTGSFVIGFLAAFFESSAAHPAWRSFLMIGILGGFTTFSSYTLESFNLLRDGEMRLALLNFLVSNLAGFALVFLGYIAFRYLSVVFK